MSKLKTIFFGTPDVSVPFLELVHEMTDVQLVVTQADKPRGRGMKVLPCPVKARALELGLPVRSPEKLKDIYEEVKNIPFDLGVAVAFGKIFRPDFLALPTLGILNVHFSLLPFLRGAAPVQHSLFLNFKKTGVSVFKISRGLDDGKILLQKSLSIYPQDDANSLFEKLIPLGKQALQEALQQLTDGTASYKKQKGRITFAPKIRKEELLLNFQHMAASKIHNKVRGLSGRAKTNIFVNGKLEVLHILLTRLQETKNTEIKNSLKGTILAIERKKGILVKCKQKNIWLTQVHPAGKKPMSAADFANGRKLKPGQRIFVSND